MQKNKLENIISWMNEKLIEGKYKSVEIVGDMQLDRAPSLTCLGQKEDGPTDFLDFPKEFFMQIHELLKSKQIDKDDTSYFELKVLNSKDSDADEACHLKITSRNEEWQENRAQAIEDYQASFPDDPFGEDFAILVAESLEELGYILRTIDPRDDTGLILWFSDEDGFHLGTYGFGSRNSLKGLKTKKQFIEWLSDESPQSLYKLGVPLKSLEIIDLIKTHRHLKKTGQQPPREWVN